MIKSRILIPITMAILFIHLAPAAAAGQPLNIWTWRNPLPTPDQLNSVTYGASLFVAVGTNGAIVTSSDGGATWDQQVVSPNISLSGVAYSATPTMFVAVGADAASNNMILTSPDGIMWTPATHTGGFGTGGLLAVACGGGYIVAVGAGGTNWNSPDGDNWEQGPTLATTTGLNGVAYGDNEFVAVGNGGGIFNTPHGSAWTPQSSGTTADLSGIAYDGTHQFVAAGFEAILTSPDGVNWNFSLTDIGTAVTYGNGEFVVVNSDTYYPGVLTSADGTNWNTDTLYKTFDAIAYGSRIFVGVGAGSGIAINDLDVTNSADWVGEVTSVTTMSLNAMAYGATAASGTNPGVNLYVAGGGGTFGEPTVVTSPDGYNWQMDEDDSLSRFQLYNSFITGMAYGAIPVTVTGPYGVFVIAEPEFVATLNALDGTSTNVQGLIISSTNGIAWATNFFNTNVLNSIAYGNGTFVAVGNSGATVSSRDLAHWAPGTAAGGGALPSAISFTGVAYGNPNSIPTFVAVGSAGGIYYSTDGGVTWTAGSGQPSSDSFHGVGYGNGQFVAVGSDGGSGGVIWTSTTGGATWAPQTSFTFMPPTTAPSQFNGVTWANGLFVAVTINGGTGGAIFVSVDGVNWVQSPIVTPNSLNAVASGNNQYIGVGVDGAIIGSLLPAVEGGSLDVATGTFSFTVSGPPGTYGVYVSSDIAGPYTWLPPMNYVFTSQSPSAMVTDPNAGRSPAGYYYLGPPGP